jgi:putative PIN family toxin of toxin-antitoxin system
MDTSVVIAGLRSPLGASAELLRQVVRGRFELLLSVALALEYRAVVTREEHLSAAGLSHEEALRVLDVIFAVAVPVEIDFLWRPQLRDPADEMVLEAAVNGRAEAIVTFNARDFKPAAELFGISVIAPKIALERTAI